MPKRKYHLLPFALLDSQTRCAFGCVAGGQEDGTRGTPCPIFAACLILPTCAICAPPALLSMLEIVPFRHSPGAVDAQGFAGLLALLEFARAAGSCTGQGIGRGIVSRGSAARDGARLRRGYGLRTAGQQGRRAAQAGGGGVFTARGPFFL